MDTTLLGPTGWAHEEFRDVDLGDRRRQKRLVKVAEEMVKESTGTLAGSLPDSKGLKAAYRLFREEDVTYEAVLTPHFERTRASCREPGSYLMVEDTTDLDYSRLEGTKGLGRIGNDYGRGLYLHPTLVLRIEGWRPERRPEVSIVGLFAQRCWARTMATVGRGNESSSVRQKRQRESERWAAVFKSVEVQPAGVQWTYVADRESDIYEVLTLCQEKRMDFVIRANQPRRLEGEEGSLFEAVRSNTVLGKYELDVVARPGRKAREAEMEVRTTSVRLRPPQRPKGKEVPVVTVNVVEAWEANAPEGEDPIHWVLLTSWPVETFEQACRVIGVYTRRWPVEEYFKALKTGARVEDVRLRDVDRIMPLIAVLSLVALRLLDAKLLARTRPHERITPETVDPDMISILESKWGKPEGGWTNETFLVAVARTGGYLARKNDGPPGWLTIWRGWRRVILMLQGYALGREKCG